MRTTLTLDDDVAVKLKAAAKDRSFKAVVNDALRVGLAMMERRAPRRRRHRTRGFNLGPSLLGSLDNVEEVLSRAEGERHT